MRADALTRSDGKVRLGALVLWSAKIAAATMLVVGWGVFVAMVRIARD
jgi:hypothetical protein